jgi:chromosome segregation ATPase
MTELQKLNSKCNDLHTTLRVQSELRQKLEKGIFSLEKNVEDHEKAIGELNNKIDKFISNFVKEADRRFLRQGGRINGLETQLKKLQTQLDHHDDETDEYDEEDLKPAKSAKPAIIICPRCGNHLEIDSDGDDGHDIELSKNSGGDGIFVFTCSEYNQRIVITTMEG